MGRQESPQLIERKTQVDTDAQETSRASKQVEKFSVPNCLALACIMHNGLFSLAKGCLL